MDSGSSQVFQNQVRAARCIFRINANVIKACRIAVLSMAAAAMVPSANAQEVEQAQVQAESATGEEPETTTFRLSMAICRVKETRDEVRSCLVELREQQQAEIVILTERQAQREAEIATLDTRIEQQRAENAAAEERIAERRADNEQLAQQIEEVEERIEDRILNGPDE